MALSDLIDAVLTDARARTAPSLIETCTVLRAARVSDGEGGSTTTYPTYLTNVPCAVSLLGSAAEESVVGEAVRAVAQYVVRVPVGTDVGSDDRVVVGTHTYEVVEALERTYDAVLRLACREVG